MIKNFGEETKFYVKGTSASLMCEVTGYPLPSVMWNFVTDEGDSQETPVGAIFIYLSIPTNFTGSARFIQVVEKTKV